MKTKNISCASNIKQRNVAKQWSADDLIVENAPFKVEKKDLKGSFEVKEVPCAYIDKLPEHIMKVLDRLDRYKILKHVYIWK